MHGPLNVKIYKNLSTMHFIQENFSILSASCHKASRLETKTPLNNRLFGL